MSNRPFILMTNDDGIHAPGLKHLWEAVTPFAEVAIVAPHKERSGSGLSITWAKPLRIHPATWAEGTYAWSVNGTPADCVKMALSVLLERKPDLILSGINRGSNSGRTIFYSGTVGGVIEGILKGIPGIAFSFCDIDPPPVETTTHYISSLVEHFLANPLPHGTFLNVTFPLRFKEGTKGFRFAKQGKGYWIESPERRVHPEGIPYYWLGGEWLSCKEEEDSDVALLEQGYVTAVPIQIGELTDMHAFALHKQAIESKFQSEQQKNLSSN